MSGQLHSQELRDHINIAIRAHRLGFIDDAGLEEALVDLYEIGAGATLEDFWVVAGPLTGEQFLASLAGDSGKAPATESLREFSYGDKQPSPSGGLTIAGLQELTQPPGESNEHPEVEPLRPLRSSDSRRYGHVRPIGEGGVGQVSECYDSVLERTVAIKSTKSTNGRKPSPKSERELIYEARVTASLEHPNIIPVYDAGTNDDGRSYCVMRYVSQPTLEDVLEGLSNGDDDVTRTFTQGRLLRDFLQICQAVDYAHSRGVIHCDLKPANVILGEFGEVMVLDWGLAFRLDDQGGFRGGTPGYMAPEQLNRDAVSFDGRIDVFALGAILYEILTYRHAIPHASMLSFAEQIGRYKRLDIIPPRECRPDLEIPGELSDITLRALAIRPDDRWASAREMAEAIESYLDRTEDLRRRRMEAQALIREGDDLSERYFEFLDTKPEQAERLTELERSIRPWDSIEKKRELWDAEALVEVTGSLRMRTLQAAVAAYEHALEQVPGHVKARRGLAQLYWSEFKEARQRRDQLNQIYFEGLVRQYDDGTLTGALEHRGVVCIHVVGEGAEIELLSQREEGRRLVAGAAKEVLVGKDMTVEAGTYLLRCRGAGAEVRYPISVMPGSRQDVDVDPGKLAELDDHEVLVPGGHALLGNEANSELAGLQLVHVEAFAIGRFPVTFAEYLAFVEDLRHRGQDVSDITPRDRKGSPYWGHVAGRWIADRLPVRNRDSDLMRLPAFGINALAAQAYADWLSRRTGRSYRLPKDAEWEKAARGTDGRRFPWGDYFDASFCKMRDSRPAYPEPEQVGAFELDASPYGVRDMAGGIAEWVAPVRKHSGPDETRRFHSRGGAWCDWEIDCTLGRRRAYFANERSARLGFRLVRDL